MDASATHGLLFVSKAFRFAFPVNEPPSIWLFQYGSTMKELIEEKFGPGIMGAIVFTMDVERLPDPKGDRVKITMNGKFLGYKK